MKWFVFVVLALFVAYLLLEKEVEQVADTHYSCAASVTDERGISLVLFTGKEYCETLYDAFNKIGYWRIVNFETRLINEWEHDYWTKDIRISEYSDTDIQVGDDIMCPTMPKNWRNTVIASRPAQVQLSWDSQRYEIKHCTIWKGG